MLKRQKHWILPLAAVVLIGLAGCGDDEKPSTAPTGGTAYGSAQAVGNGTARTFVTWGSDGNPTSVGVRLTAAALTGLPTDPSGMFERDLEFPPEAAKTPYDHLGLDWNPVGHEPPGIYNLPHFDVHFYMIDQASQDAITGIGADSSVAVRSPAPEEIPAGYIQGPGVVPRMGVHWIDPTSPEFNGATFTTTFIYGFYDGHMIFEEPMVTAAFLTSKQNFNQALKLPQVYPRANRYYPTSYSVHWDAQTSEYVISLDGLQLRP